MPPAGEGGPSFYGHREIFAVARPDLGDRAVLFYQRCFEPGREANPSICLARSDDDGATMPTYLGVIIRPEADDMTPCTLGSGELFTVAQSVVKLGDRWVLFYEAGGISVCWASSPDGLTWTKQGIMQRDTGYAWGSACEASQTPPTFREKNGACLPSCESLGGACTQTKACPGGAPERGESWDCAACCP